LVPLLVVRGGRWRWRAGGTRAAERFIIYGDGAVASAKKGGGGSEAGMAERTRPGEKRGVSGVYEPGPLGR
jgi:hypothetical protein